MLRDRQGLAAQEGFVHLQPPVVNDVAVGNDLAAGRSSRRSSTTTSATGTSTALPSRTACALGAVRAASRSSVRRARSSCDTPRGVDGQDDSEQAVLYRPDDQDDDERAQNGVETREDVGPEDLAHRPSDCRRHLTARTPPCCHPGTGEADP